MSDLTQESSAKHLGLRVEKKAGAMLTLTRKTDYALISLAHLASEAGKCASAREIAEKYGMPLPLLMNVLKLLTQKNLIQSVRGPRGGYTLARSPIEISLLDIIGAIEGPVHLVNCLGKRAKAGQYSQSEQSHATEQASMTEQGATAVDSNASGTATATLAAETVPTTKMRNGNRPKGSCDLIQCCPVRPSMHKVHAKLVQFLGEVTLAKL